MTIKVNVKERDKNKVYKPLTQKDLDEAIIRGQERFARFPVSTVSYDSKNDKILLANVGNSICMENGDPEMKKIAKITIGNNNTDSIANYLYTLIENEK